MKKHIHRILQISLSMLLIISCALYYTHIPMSSSWLHHEDMQNGSYKIGRLDFWLNGNQNASITVNINTIAPTRFFQTGTNRDDNFDMVVQNYQLYGQNEGDCDLKVNMSITDANSDSAVYYVLVPSTCQDANYLAGHYRDYLDSIFAGYTLDTPANDRAAVNAINQSALASLQAIQLTVGQQAQFCNMLIWSEYDNESYLSSSYVDINYPITVNANSYQDYYSGS